MPEQKQTQQEKHNVKIEVLEHIAALATSGFGLVAALAWNEAIKAFFNKFFPQPGGNLFAVFIEALLNTSFSVVAPIQLGRAVNLAKKQIKT